jgi:hypothetical protein
MVLGSTNVPLGTVPNLAQNIFPPSGYLPSGTTADPNIFAATTPNLPVVLRDLRVEIATAPGAGTSRTFDLINIATLQPIISCTITGSNSQCDSGGSAATLPIGTDYLMRVTNGPLAPASASWTRWAFRATTP